MKLLQSSYQPRAHGHLSPGVEVQLEVGELFHLSEGLEDGLNLTVIIQLTELVSLMLGARLDRRNHCQCRVAWTACSWGGFFSPIVAKCLLSFCMGRSS